MTLPPLPEPEVWCNVREARVNFTRHQMEAYARAALAAQPGSVGEPYSYEAAIHMMPLQYGLNSQVWLDGFRTAEAAHGFGPKLMQQLSGFAATPTEAKPAQQDAVDAERFRFLVKYREVMLLTTYFGNGCTNKTIDQVLAEIDAERAAISAKKGQS